ncbi:phosphate/phosphite/phosphonate ABC transporter substrate-binding protein [Methanolobus sp.]|uniref:phosphate/phosphite/phosphonate ABC transporter substrate-binding protein n=1 Tax=Methanolobus sp. TaxID=1874737 RepID=UPI00258A3F86|nr:phosphate/phosphite/phosphonate ABC transporter substrate-binding protein [Methanolobus sp.]
MVRLKLDAIIRYANVRTSNKGMNITMNVFQNHIKRFYILIIALILSAVLLSGCVEEQELVEEPSSQDELRIGLILWDTPVEVTKQFTGVEEYLGSELGMDVVTIKSTDYYAIIDAMEAGNLDIAFFGPFSAVISAERSGSEVIIAGGDTDGNLETYNSYIIANRKSGITNIGYLVNNSLNISFAFVNPASTSGNLIPRGYLLSQGINPDEDFKNTLFSGGHDNTIDAVLSGNVIDAGAVASMTYRNYFEDDNNSENNIVILWESDPIPTDPISVRGDMDPVLKEKIKEAFLEMHEKSPETFENFMDVREGHALYVEANNSDYAFIREMALSLGYI